MYAPIIAHDDFSGFGFRGSSTFTV
jgi:hypothetical protein